jgi:hypothetical protein
MSTQWKNTDSAANAVLWAAAGFKVKPTAANRAALYGNTTVGAIIPGQTVGLFGADINEVTARPGVSHTGWVIRKAGTGGRAGRVQYEVLVAGTMKTDNPADDAVMPNYRILFSLQPLASSASLANNGVSTFNVNTTSAPVGAPVSVLWQYSNNAGNTWANASTAGFGGYQSNSLTVNANTVANGLVRALGSSNASINATSFAVSFTTT